jgi:hypothetical protein
MVPHRGRRPDHFSTVTRIEVSDATQNWHFVATGAVLANGFATIPLADAVDAGDSISISLANVTNPPIAGTISHLSAQLDIAKSSPSSPEAQTKTVHLNQSKPANTHKKTTDHR